MAASNGADSVALPEEKVARRVLADLGLSPPFSIRSVVEKFADVEEDDIPGHFDAVLLGQSRQRKRPLIVLQRSIAPARKTFTLAHELGHIVLPWQCGTFALHPDRIMEAFDVPHEQIESEANRFASEFLMPRDWIAALTADPFSPVDVVRELKNNGVSTLAACFGLVRHLPPGYVFAEADEAGIVTYSARSRGTVPNVPEPKRELSPDYFGDMAVGKYAMAASGNTVHWWQLTPRIAAPSGTTGYRSSREVLASIYAELGVSMDERTRFDNVIGGIVGHAYDMWLRDRGSDLFTIVKARFLGRRTLKDVTAHPRFEAYLAMKTEELAKRPIPRWHANRSDVPS